MPSSQAKDPTGVTAVTQAATVTMPPPPFLSFYGRTRGIGGCRGVGGENLWKQIARIIKQQQKKNIHHSKKKKEKKTKKKKKKTETKQ